MKKKEIIKEIGQKLREQGCIFSFTFFPRFTFKGVKVLSCTEHSIDCIVHGGTVNNKLTLSFELLSDEFLEEIRDHIKN